MSPENAPNRPEFQEDEHGKLLREVQRLLLDGIYSAPAWTPIRPHIIQGTDMFGESGTWEICSENMKIGKHGRCVGWMLPEKGNTIYGLFEYDAEGKLPNHPQFVRQPYERRRAEVHEPDNATHTVPGEAAGGTYAGDSQRAVSSRQMEESSAKREESHKRVHRAIQVTLIAVSIIIGGAIAVKNGWIDIPFAAEKAEKKE